MAKSQRPVVMDKLSSSGIPGIALDPSNRGVSNTKPRVVAIVKLSLYCQGGNPNMNTCCGPLSLSIAKLDFNNLYIFMVTTLGLCVKQSSTLGASYPCPCPNPPMHMDFGWAVVRYYYS